MISTPGNRVLRRRQRRALPAWFSRWPVLDGGDASPSTWPSVCWRESACWRWRASSPEWGGANSICSHCGSGDRAADTSFRNCTSSLGRNTTPAPSKARRIASAVIALGCRRSSSKSSISLPLTEAALDSLLTDQRSRVRAQRHCEALIMVLGVLRDRGDGCRLP